MEMTQSFTQPLNLSAKAMEDYELVQQACAGSQQAYAMLMDRYRDVVYGQMMKMVGTKEDADDLVLEAFGKAFKSLHTYTPNYAFSTWLFRIATNNCIDFVRKKKYNTMSIDATGDSESKQDFSSFIRSTANDPEEKIISTQKVKKMRDVLKKLNPKYRLMLELRFFEDLSYQQIADELEIPLGTVKAQLFRAKEIIGMMMDNPDMDNNITFDIFTVTNP
jgi:RNA polymerase sigma factor (sigma-70 family)